MSRIRPLLLLSAIALGAILMGCPTPFGYYAAGNNYTETVQVSSQASFTAAATPTFRAALATGGADVIVSGSPTENADQLVTIVSTETDAQIYYTTDGSIPNPNVGSTRLFDPTKPISVAGNNTSVTINAVAFKAQMRPSAVATLTMLVSYTTASSPTFDKIAGTYSSAFPVNINSAAGSTVWYTTDGSAPVVGGGGSTQSSSVLPISVNITRTTTLRAVASAPGFSTSNEATVSYVLQPTTPSFSVPGGTYNSAQTVTINSSTAGSVIWYTTDGSTPTAGGGSSQGGTATVSVTVSTSETLKAIASQSGWTDSPVASATYTLSALAPTINPPGATFPTSQTVSITAPSAGTLVWYTTDGTNPIPGTSSGGTSTVTLSLTTNTEVRAVAAASGWTTSPVSSDFFVYGNGLQLYWPFNDAGSGTAIDGSGNGFNGTVSGAVATTDRFGTSGAAYQFNGTSASITESTQLFAATSTVSISAWVYPSSTNSGLLYFATTTGAGMGLWQSGTQLGLAISTPGTNSAAGTTTLNAWHFLVGTYDGTNITFYIDGVQVGTPAPQSGSISAPTGLTLGFWNSAYWAGAIEELRIYNRVLSAAEVASLYTFPD